MNFMKQHFYKIGIIREFLCLLLLFFSCRLPPGFTFLSESHLLVLSAGGRVSGFLLVEKPTTLPSIWGEMLSGYQGQSQWGGHPCVTALGRPGDCAAPCPDSFLPSWRGFLSFFAFQISFSLCDHLGVHFFVHLLLGIC